LAIPVAVISALRAWAANRLRKKIDRAPSELQPSLRRSIAASFSLAVAGLIIAAFIVVGGVYPGFEDDLRPWLILGLVTCVLVAMPGVITQMTHWRD
jgi:hypothetical protein